MSDEELARKSAYIMGESSAAAQAVAELDRRRAAGEDVSVYNVQRSWVVGPKDALVPPGKWRVDVPDGLYTQMPGDPPGPCDLRKVIGGYVYEVEPRTGRLAATSPPSEFGLKNGAQTARGVMASGSWRPIDTVPKDGREVILREGSRVGAACWTKWPQQRGPNGEVCEDAGEGWTAGYDGDLWTSPTHWQPMPAADGVKEGQEPEPSVREQTLAGLVKRLAWLVPKDHAARIVATECLQKFGYLSPLREGTAGVVEVPRD